MPGVNVDTASRPSPLATAAPDTAQYFVVGLTERGSTTGYETVGSLAEFDDKCGGVTTYGFVRDDLRRFFLLGGARAHVARVVGPAATVATKTLQDRAGTPLNTLRLDAANPGVWGSAHLTVRVEAGTTSGTYKIVVAYDGVDVETKDNLTTPADAVTAFALSRYIRAVNLTSATAAPNNQPALLAATALTGGADDRAAVITSHLTSALARFPKDLGTGAVAIPGYGADIVGAALKAHANENRRVAGMAPVKGADIATVTALADTLDGLDGSNSILLYPWLETDGVGTPLVSPEGVWAGLRASAHRRIGPWAIPAGQDGDVGFVTGVEVELTRAQGDALDAAKVSVFRKIRQAGSYTYRLYGYRSLSTDPDFAMLKTRDLLNYLVVALEEDFESTVFKTVDSRGVRAGEAEVRVANRLDPLVAAGALFDQVNSAGIVVGPPYHVDAGPSINTPAVLARNEFDVYVGVRDSPVAAIVGVHIVKVGLTTPA